MIQMLAIVAALGVVLFVGNLLVSYYLGVSLLCHFGLHRWQRVLVGRGRDARYIVKCKGCEALKDES